MSQEKFAIKIIYPRRNEWYRFSYGQVFQVQHYNNELYLYYTEGGNPRGIYKEDCIQLRQDWWRRTTNDEVIFKERNEDD